MDKQKRQLALIGIVLVILIFLFAGMRAYNKKHPEDTESVSYPITEDAVSQIEEFSFTNESGRFAFVKEGESFRLKEDAGIAIDTVALEDMIRTAASLQSENKIEKAEDMAQYGLDTPQITVSYRTAEKSVIMEIGAYNSTVSLYYMRLAGEDTVYTIDSTVRNIFTKDIEELKTVVTEE